MFRRAIVRLPAENFADGQTTVDLGVPDFEKAVAQHERYCEALVSCGLALTRLHADPRHPDSTFVEDTALIAPGGAILTRPGAPSREGEVADMEPALQEFFPALRRIQPPGTVDGGDVCDARRPLVHRPLGAHERGGRAAALRAPRRRRLAARPPWTSARWRGSCT